MRREASVSRLAAALLAALGTVPFAAQSATIIVSNNNDSGAGTLRNAIATANTGDTITFDTTAFPNGGSNTITLGNGQLSISVSNLTIDATANGNVTIDANHASRVMYDNAAFGGTLTLNHMTLTNGKALTYCSGFAQGGGICSIYANLALNDSTLSGNSTGTFGGFGGAIVARLGSATLTRCTLTGNSATNGGAIDAETSVTLIDSTLSGNTATQKGGGIYAPHGGVALTNSTLYGNSARYGGAVYGGVVFSPVTLEQTTVAGNSASVSGGGLLVQASSGVVMNNSLFASNKVPTSDENITGPSGGTTIAGNNNLVFRDPVSGDGMVNATFANAPLTGDPKLGALTNNGSPTQTMLPGAGSAAINAAPCLPAIGTDQRGFIRPDPASRNSVTPCDIGAVEANSISDEIFANGFEP